ncbi:MAG: aldo/keto reductase [Chloroflexi bacterium]|nr:aldo/keto reductase [Chloroflexota bacterium]
MIQSAYGTFAIGGDLPVDRVGFGAMRLARNLMGDTVARYPETARAVLRRAVALGVNHIDTADFYRSPDGAVRANDLIRESLFPYPEGLVIATKVGPVFGPGGPTQGTPADIRPAVEANLKVLGVDRVDLVYLRIGWREPPRGESLGERFQVLADIRKAGFIRHLGLSNVNETHLTEAQRIAPVVAIQNLFNPANADEVALARRAADDGIAFVPFGPLGSGQSSARDAVYAAVAQRRGATIAQVAIAHVLALSPSTLVIPGTGSLRHLEENVAARSLELTHDDLAALS